jgi:DNA mismatch endonuclease (patch repair protein)
MRSVAHSDSSSAAQGQVRPRRQRRLLTKSEQMARVKSRDTGLEMQVRRRLWAAGARYRVRPMLPGTPDLAFQRAHVAVFVDGCFWHGCPDHYRAPATNVAYWKHKLERNLSLDRRVELTLTEGGWSVVRIWEHEIKSDPSSVVNRLLEATGRGQP